MSPAERIAHYDLICQIGRGGQGTVYLAEDQHLRRQVALKVMDPGFAADGIAVQRFRREAEITSKLDHPCICTVYESGEDRGILWIAMRYVEGESLARKVAAARQGPVGDSPSTFVVAADGARPEAPLPDRERESGSTARTTGADIARLLLLFEEAARALHAAHEVGVIHRDVKPGNMVVTPEGRPVILDFGLAVDTASDEPGLTVTGDLMGTKEYMSPEQITARRIGLDRRTDVYSLGVSLFECLTLRRPFEAPTREGLYQAIMAKEPPDPRTLNPAIPRDLCVVVATAIEKDRDRRYATALDFAEELRRVRVHEPIVARPVGPLVHLKRWAQRNRALAVAVGGLFVALVAGLAVALALLGARDRALAERTAALEDYDRLGDIPRLERLRADAARLWPCEPSMLPAMRAWLGRATELARRLDDHRGTLASLRAAISSGGATADIDQFKHDTSARLVADLTAFVDPDPATGLLADVRGRVAFAESVEGETIGKYEREWDRAVRSIADVNECPRYAGLKIRPQVGLVPVGRDPASGLWEFVHLQTSGPGSDPVPPRGSDGRLRVTESSGLVFVLLPAGTYTMGATRDDGDAHDDEGPARPVALGAFFLSKYEMTQGQWLRTAGANPSRHGPGSDLGGHVVDLRHPIEGVSWDDCDLWLRRLGLLLPSEAQWEFGARAGTTTPRCTGSGTAGLGAIANLADDTLDHSGGSSTLDYVPWSDGYAIHAPVGSFAPNAFGLHDVLGNVWEWCRDAYGPYDEAPRADDGLRDQPGARTRVNRGGGWSDGSPFARSSARNAHAPEYRGAYLGVRPARACVID